MSGHDLIVIGGGEAGISAALQGSALGAKVLMINRELELGGGCVRTGTLPSKVLSNAAHFLENLKKARRYGVTIDENAAVDYKAILESRHKTTLCEVGILATLIRKNAIETLTGLASFRGPGPSRSGSPTAPLPRERLRRSSSPPDRGRSRSKASNSTGGPSFRRTT